MNKQFFCTCLIFFLLSSISFSQTERFDYKKIDYLKVEQDQYQAVVTLAKEQLKPVFGELAGKDHIKKWRLYVVDYPGGEQSSYNIVSITTVTGIDAIQSNFNRVGSAAFIPDAAGNNVASRLGEKVKVVASEIWKVRSLIAPDSVSDEPSTYMTMDYMDVVSGKGLEYLMLEDEVAMPLHRERVNRDKMDGWEVYSLVIPGGTEYGYNYATGNYFSKLENIEFGFTQELIEQTMPGTDIGDLLDTVYNTRDLVKSEVWRLMVHAD